LSSLGIMAGVAALTGFLALGRGVRMAVLGRWIADLPAEEVYVTVPLMEIGPIQVDRPKALGGGKILDNNIIERLRNLTVPAGDPAGSGEVRAVEKVWRQLDADFPASITGSLLGVTYGTDTAITGVDPEMVIGNVSLGAFSYQPGAAEGAADVPALAPRALLDVYNSAFARAQELPKLSPGFLIGKHFAMQLGASSISSVSSGSVLQARGVIVGFTDRGALLGVTVPIEYVEEWNGRIGKKDRPSGYRALTVIARDPRYVPAISEAVRRMGFEARSSTGLAERVGGIIALVTAGLSLIAGLILLVAMLNAWSLFRLMAMERRTEMSLLMALGATPWEVRSLVLAEASAVGLAGGLSGAMAAAITGWIINRTLGYFADIPFLPDRLILFSPGIIFSGIALALITALLSSWPAARELSRIKL